MILLSNYADLTVVLGFLPLFELTKFFFFFGPFMATGTVYGSSQARS